MTSSGIIRALTGTSDHPELTFRRTYRSSVAQVRQAFIRADRLARWFGSIDGEPSSAGDEFTARLSDDPDDVAQGRVLHCEDDSLAVAWSWQGERESVIAARWREVDDGQCEVTVRHTLGEQSHAVGYGGGWEQVLQSLARSLGFAEAGAPDDDEIERAGVQAWRTITRAPLELTKRVPAPVAEVWQAFTTESGMQSWWWNHWDDVAISADAREGGRYRIAVPSQGIELRGSYLAVEHESRLAFTWEWNDADEAGEMYALPDEAVDVTFATDGQGGTILTIRHSGPWEQDAPAQNYAQGWEFTLDELVRQVGGAN